MKVWKIATGAQKSLGSTMWRGISRPLHTLPLAAWMLCTSDASRTVWLSFVALIVSTRTSCVLTLLMSWVDDSTSMCPARVGDNTEVLQGVWVHGLSSENAALQKSLGIGEGSIDGVNLSEAA